MGELPHAIGPYKVIRPLGAGGFSQVFLGQDTRGGSLVAIKRVRPDLSGRDPMYRRSIVVEGRVAGALDVPNFPRLAELIAVEGEPVVVLEYVHGFGLDRLLGRVSGRGIPAACVAEIGCQLAAALAALHEGSGEGGGHVHQDLKPSNIRITPEGVVKVLDLGIAAPIERPLRRIRQGTPGYRSPEQVEGARSLSAASDLYALGILLYELSVGRRLFSERVCHDAGLIRGAQREVPGRLQAAGGLLPRGLVPILEGLLADDPAARISTAAQAREALGAWRESLGGAASFPRWARRMNEVLSAGAASDDVAAQRAAALARLSAPRAALEGAGREPESLKGAEGAGAAVQDVEPWPLAPTDAGARREDRWLIAGAAALLILVFFGGLLLGVNTHPTRFGSLAPAPAAEEERPFTVLRGLEAPDGGGSYSAPPRTSAP